MPQHARAEAAVPHRLGIHDHTAGQGRAGRGPAHHDAVTASHRHRPGQAQLHPAFLPGAELGPIEQTQAAGHLGRPGVHGHGHVVRERGGERADGAQARVQPHGRR